MPDARDQAPGSHRDLARDAAGLTSARRDISWRERKAIVNQIGVARDPRLVA